jgi:ABC-type Fe3+-hydroxamate transport system substrate-binding protein
METYSAEQAQLEIPVETPPRRIVSLVPSMTESLFDLALGDRLVGRTRYCVYPVNQVDVVPVVGGTKDPDIGMILDLRPDLVIMNQEENQRQHAQALQEAGVPVWITFPKTVPDVFNMLWNIMYVCEETSMVPRIRLLEYTYDWVLGVTKANEDRFCKVFVPIWSEPLMTINADTYMHDLLAVCGGTNVFAERNRRFPLAADVGDAESLAEDDPRVQGRDTRYPRVSLEEVVAAQPDVILLPDEPYTFGEADLPRFAALDVPAAHQNQIHLVDGSLLSWHGTRLAYALEQLPPLLCARETLTADDLRTGE